MLKKVNVVKYYNLLILSIESKEDILNCKFNLLKSYLNRMLRKIDVIECYLLVICIEL